MCPEPEVECPGWSWQCQDEANCLKRSKAPSRFSIPTFHNTALGLCCLCEPRESRSSSSSRSTQPKWEQSIPELSASSTTTMPAWQNQHCAHLLGSGRSHPLCSAARCAGDTENPQLLIPLHEAGTVLPSGRCWRGALSAPCPCPLKVKAIYPP